VRGIYTESGQAVNESGERPGGVQKILEVAEKTVDIF
jgi:hypothetical protein